MVELESGMRFQTAYHGSHLAQTQLDAPFCIEHSQLFVDLVDVIQDSGIPFTATQIQQVALNGTAAHFFHKSVAHKSWLFDSFNANVEQDSMRLGWLLSGSESALVMSFHQDGACLNCLNLSDSFTLTNGKSYGQFALLKVHSDRLFPLDNLDELEMRIAKRA